jgi:ubiquinone/menaquinone biosynthesis C-methylase UbiE
VTALDATACACEAVRQQFSQESLVDVVQANILDLPEQIRRRRFDLVFAWGVLHHTGDTERALKNVCRLVKRGGLVYVYLYGKASVTHLTGLKIALARSLLLPFSPGMKKRILSLFLPEERLHSTYDMLSPPINERVTEHQVRRWFSEAGFDQAQRTIHHTELFLKAWRPGSSVTDYFREPKTPPYWFQRPGRSGAV